MFAGLLYPIAPCIKVLNEHAIEYMRYQGAYSMTKRVTDANGESMEVETGSAIDVEQCIRTAIACCDAASKYSEFDIQIIGDAHGATRNWQITNVCLRVLSREIFYNNRETLVKL